MALLLVEWKLLPLPLLYLSGYFERDRDSYYRGLSAVSKRGTWREWVEYFLRGVRDEARDAVERLRKLVGLRETWRAQLGRQTRSASPLLLIDQLFEAPIVTIPGVAKSLNITYPSARKAVEKLLKAGILRLETEADYGKSYRADDIIKIVSSY